MGKIELKLSKKEIELFKVHGTVINTVNGNKYYNLPQWIEEEGDNYYLVESKNLPHNVRKFIQELEKEE